MSYSSRDGRPDARRSSTSHRPPDARRSTARGGSTSGRNPRSSRNARTGSRGGSSRSQRNQTRTRNLTGPDTGYTLHSHRVSYSRRGGTTRDRLGFVNGRFILLLVIVIVVVVVLIAGISSCVSGSSRTQNTNQDEQEQTESRPRVASGISSELTQQFNTVLDRDDQIAQIAQSADQYDDERLLTLALNEPEAVSFVANYLTADKSASSFTDEVTRGQVPQLYDWDTRWGYVSYGDGCIGVTGSALTTTAMAYMGLTGRSDVTPATLAQGTSTTASGSSNSNSSSSSNNTNTNGSSSSSSSSTASASDSAEGVIELMSQAGLDATQYDSSSDTLVACLSSSSVAAVYIDEDGLQDGHDAHWALVVGMNQDGTLNVFDPTSSLVSTRTWDSSTIARASSTILYVTVSEGTQTADSSSNSNDTSSSSSSSDEEYGTSTSSGSNNSSTSSSSSNRNSSGSSNSNGSNANSSSSSSGSSSSSSGSSSSGSSSSGDYVGL